MPRGEIDPFHFQSFAEARHPDDAPVHALPLKIRPVGAPVANPFARVMGLSRNVQLSSSITKSMTASSTLTPRIFAISLMVLPINGFNSGA